MKTTFLLMKKLIPFFNRRRVTWQRIEKACRKLKALLFCKPLNFDGYFVPPDISASGKPEIYVNCKLSEDRQIATAVHELKHSLLDSSRNKMLFSFRKDWTVAARREWEEEQKFEVEACAMGAIALLPEKKIRNASRGLFDEEDEFIEDIWKIRLYTREIYGI